VTFRQVDPLWIIDLSDPARPTVAGELQVPGWSTYIHPLGGRLVTIGRDSARAGELPRRCSTFKIRRIPPCWPRRVGEQYSSSEANSDEKAFGVLPEAGLILVPYSSWATNGYFQGVQLIDLASGSLALRGPPSTTNAGACAPRCIATDNFRVGSGVAERGCKRPRPPGPPFEHDTGLACGSSLPHWPIPFGNRARFGKCFPVRRCRGAGGRPEPDVEPAHPDQSAVPRLDAARRPSLRRSGSSAQINWQGFADQPITAVSTNLGVFSLTVLELVATAGADCAGPIRRFPRRTISGATGKRFGRNRGCWFGDKQLSMRQFGVAGQSISPCHCVVGRRSVAGRRRVAGTTDGLKSRRICDAVVARRAGGCVDFR